MALALLPVEFVCWIGFALPFGPPLVLARTALVVAILVSGDARPAGSLAAPRGSPVAEAGRWRRRVAGKSLAEVTQEVADASRDGLVAFDLASPTLAAGLVGERAVA